MGPDRAPNTTKFYAFYMAWGPLWYKLAGPEFGLSRIPSRGTDGLSTPGILYSVFLSTSLQTGNASVWTVVGFNAALVLRSPFIQVSVSFEKLLSIFDLGVAFLLFRLIVENQKRLLAFKFWMINPVVILVCYAHGQYDIVPTFFVALSLYYVAVGKSARSLFSLGIGAAFKHFSFLFLIPALMLLGRSRIAKIKLML